MRKTIPVSRRWSGSPPEFNHLFTGPLTTFPENFMQIHVKVFFLRRVANRQTNKQRRKHVLFGGGDDSFLMQLHCRKMWNWFLALLTFDSFLETDWISLLQDIKMCDLCEKTWSWELWATVCKTVCPVLSVRCLSVMSVCPVLSLSLIHIWRCRRSTLCRSRWSPYH